MLRGELLGLLWLRGVLPEVPEVLSMLRPELLVQMWERRRTGTTGRVQLGRWNT